MSIILSKSNDTYGQPDVGDQVIKRRLAETIRSSIKGRQIPTVLDLLGWISCNYSTPK